MFKFNGGFTLVELVVVIAILAILAGVAVPAYSGYIEKANDAADLVAANAVKTAVFAAYAEEGLPVPTTITISGGAVSGLEGDVKTNFEFYYPDAIPADLTASWDGTKWEIK